MHIREYFQGYWTPPEEECDIPTLPSFDPKLLANAPPELLRGSRQSMVRICFETIILISHLLSPHGWPKVGAWELPRTFSLRGRASSFLPQITPLSR